MSKRERITQVILTTTLFVLIGIIIYLNFTKLFLQADTDYFVELNYGREVWEKKSILPNGWVAGNELMFFRPTVLYAIFYGITGKYLMSYAVALTVSMFITLLAYIYMLKSFDFSNNSILFSLVLLLSMSGSDRSFVVLTFLFYGYYCFYVASTFFMIGLLQKLYKEKNVSILERIVAFTITVLLGIVGNRMMIFLYIPLQITVFIVKYFKDNNIKIDKNYVKYSIALFLTNVLGMFLGKQFFYSSIPYPVKILNMTKFKDMGERIWENLSAVLQMVVGSEGGIPLKGMQSLDTVLKGILLLVVITFIYKNRNKFKSSILILFFVVYFIFIFGIQIVTDALPANAWYYYLIPCLIVIVSTKLYEIEEYRKYIIYLSYAVIISNFMANYWNFVKKKADSDSVEVVSYLETNNINRIISGYWTGGIFEAYSDGKVRSGYWMPFADNDIISFLHMADIEYYRYNDSPTYAVLSTKQETEMLENTTSKLNTYKNEKVFDGTGYKVYKFDINPIGIFDTKTLNYAIEYSPKLFNLGPNGELQEDGSIISKGLSDSLFFGPYIDIDKGNFDIEFDYEILSEGLPVGIPIGYVDITSSGAEKKIATKEIKPQSKLGTILLENVEFNNDKSVEFRVFGYEGYKFRISKVRITRNR